MYKFVETHLSKSQFHYCIYVYNPGTVKLMKPYARDEAMNDRTKARFNAKLSAIRTEFTENVFAWLKQRYVNCMLIAT